MHELERGSGQTGCLRPVLRPCLEPASRLPGCFLRTQAANPAEIQSVIYMLNSGSSSRMGSMNNVQAYWPSPVSPPPRSGCCSRRLVSTHTLFVRASEALRGLRLHKHGGCAGCGPWRGLGPGTSLSRGELRCQRPVWGGGGAGRCCQPFCDLANGRHPSTPSVSLFVTKKNFTAVPDSLLGTRQLPCMFQVLRTSLQSSPFYRQRDWGSGEETAPPPPASECCYK